MEIIQNNSKYDWRGGGGGNYVSSMSANVLGYKYLNEIYVQQIIRIVHFWGSSACKLGPSILPRGYKLTHINILVTYGSNPTRTF